MTIKQINYSEIEEFTSKVLLDDLTSEGKPFGKNTDLYWIFKLDVNLHNVDERFVRLVQMFRLKGFQSLLISKK